MKILFVYPAYPDTFWSFKHVLKIISKKASSPPLGLLTVAAMLPGEWDKRLIDLNITALTDEQIRWADYVFVGAMSVQRASATEVIKRCNRLGTKVVAGGPMFTTGYDEFSGVDHFVLGEAEVTLPQFLTDMARGCARPIYQADREPDITQTPLPMWSLLNMKQYSAMSIQYSRGCPFNCEFCDVTLLNGHKPRTKDTIQMVREMDALYNHGWRGSVFLVDDNFVGNRKKLKAEILPVMVEWSKRRQYPFDFYTQASVNLADDDELMQLMAQAGFDKVFIGIETPNEDSLAECNKQQNRGRDLVAAVKRMQNHGFEVQGGFIVGFDNDPVSIFRNQINFIQKSGIVTAMVGLLNAPKGTQLYNRLKKENRILQDISGDNMDCSMNFVPRMNYETLLNGYQHILHTIYSPKPYYERISTFLREYKPQRRRRSPYRLRFHYLSALIKASWLLGVRENGRGYYWKLLISTLFRKPQAFSLSVVLAVIGFHFRQVIAKSANSAIPAGQ
ncbi:MAG: B12-binding domain-containing radical SAM protein [Chloroflexi bacterium]|nr:B12-binding domain-containing radical SAM protein [Chloroflexota bacterium]